MFITKVRYKLVPLVVAVGLGLLSCAEATPRAFPAPPADPLASQAGSETAVFAGGCFWGVQGVFERVKGVTDTVAGYSGGTVPDPTYEMVSSGTTGHAETVKITFDPSQVSFATLLKIFFTVVADPTELNYQGPDHGTQYRSVIFYTNDAQKRIADEYISTIGAAKYYSSPIVTQVVPFSAFYPAEDYHQHFLDNNPNNPYIMFWDLPKIAALKKLYPALDTGAPVYGM